VQVLLYVVFPGQGVCKTAFFCGVGQDNFQLRSRGCDVYGSQACEQVDQGDRLCLPSFIYRRLRCLRLADFVLALLLLPVWSKLPSAAFLDGYLLWARAAFSFLPWRPLRFRFVCGAGPPSWGPAPFAPVDRSAVAAARFVWRRVNLCDPGSILCHQEISWMFQSRMVALAHSVVCCQ
jgi:hypothetical protein